MFKTRLQNSSMKDTQAHIVQMRAMIHYLIRSVVHRADQQMGLLCIPCNVHDIFMSFEEMRILTSLSYNSN